MRRLILHRVVLALPLMLLVTAFVFVLVDLAPGDPARRLAGENPTPERVEHVRQELGLDRPLPVRYANWVGDAIRGDLGSSFSIPRPVTQMIGRRLSPTFSLVLVAVVVSVVVGTAMGIVAALHPDGLVDRAVTATSALLIAVPQFWLGMLLVVFLAVNRNLFPAVGYTPLREGFGEWLRHLVLPGFALSTVALGELALQLRDALLGVLGREYMLTAEAKGLSRKSIVGKHALKNAAIPVVTVLGYRVAQLIGGTVLIESVFAIPGLGSLAVSSVLGRDIPVVLGLVVLTTILVLAINLVVDVSYGYFNPRART